MCKTKIHRAERQQLCAWIKANPLDGFFQEEDPSPQSKWIILALHIFFNNLDSPNPNEKKSCLHDLFSYKEANIFSFVFGQSHLSINEESQYEY